MKFIWSCEWAVTFGTTGRAGWDVVNKSLAIHLSTVQMIIT